MLAANEQGLLLCWYFIMSSPEPLLIENTNVHLLFSVQLCWVKLEQKLNRDLVPITCSSPAICANAMLCVRFYNVCDAAILKPIHPSAKSEAISYLL